MLNQEMFALLFKAHICETLSPKGYWHVSVLICWFLVSLLCYWIRLKIFILTLLGEKKKLNLNIVKATSMLVGSLMTISFLALVFSLLFCSFNSFWTNVRIACCDGYEKMISLCKASILGPRDKLLEHLVLHSIFSYTKGVILILRVCTPNHWFTSLLHLLHLFIAVACAF